MLSIVVPVYKSEKTLAGCLDSLLAQTYKDIEVICVVDGSPDSCGDICDAYAAKDARVKSIKRENGGVSSARNRGTGFRRRFGQARVPYPLRFPSCRHGCRDG